MRLFEKLFFSRNSRGNLCVDIGLKLYLAQLVVSAVKLCLGRIVMDGPTAARKPAKAETRRYEHEP